MFQIKILPSKTTAVLFCLAMLFPKIEFAAENPKSVLNSSTCNLRSEVKPESKKNPSKSEKNKPVSFSLGMITGSSQCLSGNSFDFNSFSTISSGAITNQFWDFGDGKTATGASVNHSYAIRNFTFYFID